MIAAVVAMLFAVIPVHGLVLQSLSSDTVIVRTDPVVAMLPAQTRRYRVVPAQRFASGTTIDALLDLAFRPLTLRDAVPAASFSPGLPDRLRAVPVTVGATLPNAVLVDQNGEIVRLRSAFRGKTLVLSFVFTRCPDRTLCPAISGKFAYLQQRLDDKRFALAEITLDPQYDSPTVLQRYGAAYGARTQSWRLLTGTGSTIQRLLDAFAISSMRINTSNFLHDDRLFIVTPAGRVADIVQTAGWDPNSVLAEARAVSGISNNPLERFKLALIANVVALCGGSEATGILLLELSLFTAFTIVAIGGLWVVARVLWS